MRLLLDEMIGPRLAELLREQGRDVIAIAERSDLRALPDEAVLQFAQQDDRILVTRNVADFARLDRSWQATGRQHCGLVLVLEHAFPQNRNLIGALAAALAAAFEHELLPHRDAVLYLRPAPTVA